jgi:glycine betaine/choline ABC-type transport system substrate-binding protein
VSAKIDTKTLAQLYYDVAINHKDLADVAKAWLTANGFAS